MITQGRQQIYNLTYGKAIIGTMSIGHNRILGWLSSPTLQVFKAAFGQTKGVEAIKATNAYLSSIEATDPTKAQALAAFINEDLAPWMNAYCSEYLNWVYDLMPWLGTEVWIRTASSSAFFRTGVSKALNDQVVEKTYCKYTVNNTRRLSGISSNSGGYWGITVDNTFEMHKQGETDTTYVTDNSITQKNFVQKDYISGRDSGELQLFALNGSFRGKGYDVYRLDSQIYKNGVLVRWYVPFIRNGVVGYLNLLNGTMATRNSNFTTTTVSKVTPWDILSLT